MTYHNARIHHLPSLEGVTPAVTVDTIMSDIRVR